MKEYSQILAKSKKNGAVDLLQHSEHVAQAIVKIASGVVHPFDIELARKGAVLHDLGKAHPYFQRSVHDNDEALSFKKRRENKYVHRHEISSLAFLPVFPRNEWDCLIDMVVAHHKSIQNDSRERGILDIQNKERHWISNHLEEWDSWFRHGRLILAHFGYGCPEISIGEAGEALYYAAQHCENKKFGWSSWRGLLKAADHFASAFNNDTANQLQHLFEAPDITFYKKAERRNTLFPLSDISTDDSRKHTIVVAPTGAGKTDFLVRRTRARFFYTLPFQASINAMWKRFKETIPNKDIRLLHATSQIVTGNNVQEQILQPLVGSAVKVLTPHQLAAIIFGTAGFESVILDVTGCDVILDEIHTYSDYSRAMVLEIIKTLRSLHCRIHIGTATMPTKLYNEILHILGGSSEVYEVKLSATALDQFDRHIIFKHDQEDGIAAIIEASIERKEKLLLIYNTVKKAQQAYKEYEERFPDLPKMLLHSRFKRKDRFEKELLLQQKFNGDGKGDQVYSPCMVISTQVVEVSLDISFDRMITQCAPLDSLIQRFGRVNRRRSEDTIGKYKPVHVLAPSGNALPYRKEILEKSFDQLPGSGELLKERNIQAMIDHVYPALDKMEIDIHLKFKDGKMNIKELSDNKSSVLIEALEIEGATCILEADREAYLLSDWEERIQLEIPVNWKTISPYRSSFEQLDAGSDPFVIPQDSSAYDVFGLQLIEHNNIM